jgi:sulfur-oxidizing protein SoxY
MHGLWNLTRRAFLRVSALAGAIGLLGLPGRTWAVPGLGRLQTAKDPANPTPFERGHLPQVQLPLIAEDGANVPILVEMEMMQEPNHYIASIEIFNFNDPVINKGTYHFTPASGRVFLGTQFRMNAGDSRVHVVAECNQHGKWVFSRDIKVSVGGC